MSPLSELVWSPNEGLSIKIASSSLTTKKASLRWNTDTFNIAITSPRQSAGGKSSDNRDASIGSADKMPSQLRSYSESSMRVAMPSPNRRKPDAQQTPSIRLQDQDSKCCGEINSLNKVEEVFDNDHVDKMESEEKVGNDSSSCSKDASHGKTSCPGPASRKDATSSIAEDKLPCATTVQNETFWTKNAWRARLVEAIGLKNSVLPESATDIKSPSCLRDLGNAGNIADKSTGFVGDAQYRRSDNESKKIGAIATPQVHDELKDENIQENCKDEPVVARCESASGVNPRNLEKGKEKVIYSESNCASDAKESNDSNDSIESSPNTKIPKRKCALGSTSKMSFGSKKCKREDNESSCSGLLLRNGSSFLNWMSTLTNGSNMFDQSTPTVPLDRRFLPAVTREDFGSPPVSHQNVPLQAAGFNSLFQSLYCHNVMITSRNRYHQTESNHTEHVANRLTLDLNGSTSLLDKPNCTGIERFHMATETFAANNLQIVCGGDTGNSQNQVGVLPLRAVNISKSNHTLACRPNSSNKSRSGSPEEKQTEFYGSSSNVAMEDGGGLRKSFWITRLLPKTSVNLFDPVPCNARGEFFTVDPNNAANKLHCSSQQNATLEKVCNNLEDCASNGSDETMKSRKCPTLPSDKFKKSETMASIFAKRLDALRHAKPPAVGLAITCKHGSSRGRNHSTSSFVVGCNSHDGLEAEQENHRSPSKDGRMVLWSEDEQKEQQHNDRNEKSIGKFVPKSEFQLCAASTAGKVVTPQGDNLEANLVTEDSGGREVKLKEAGSNSLENLPNNKQIVPYGFVTPNDVCDESSEIFGALRKLRLSRTDIIRWLRSPIMHTTLDGFFLRLRFGRWEEALGGTGYHVACINGAVDGNRLSVSIRNSTCQVDSRFVSNHDFHEEELKAWWSAALKGGCKLPSKEELDRKLKEREMLPF